VTSESSRIHPTSVVEASRECMRVEGRQWGGRTLGDKSRETTNRRCEKNIKRHVRELEN
jgi:hypothetical protein